MAGLGLSTLVDDVVASFAHGGEYGKERGNAQLAISPKGNHEWGKSRDNYTMGADPNRRGQIQQLPLGASAYCE